MQSLLDAAGIRMLRARAVSTIDEAADAAHQIGLPVALKAVGPTIVHKTDVGGVRLALASDADVRTAALDMQTRLGERLTGSARRRDVSGMVDELRGARLLRGCRGAPPADEPSLHDVLLRLSALIDACPEIQELDINPLRVLIIGAVAVDARVRIERTVPAVTARRVLY